MYDDTVECRCYGQLLLHPCHVSNNTSEPQGGNEGLSINLTIYHHHPHKTTMHLSSVTKPQNRWTYIHLNPARRSSKLTWVGMVHGYWVPLMHDDTQGRCDGQEVSLYPCHTSNNAPTTRWNWWTCTSLKTQFQPCKGGPQIWPESNGAWLMGTSDVW